MNRFTALAAVVSLFGVGVIVGGLAVHLHYVRTDRPFLEPREGQRERFFMDRLRHELNLTPEQDERLDEILRQAHAEAEALHRELVPRVREHMRRTEAAIRELLTPEQQAKFDELQRLHHERAERFLLGEGPFPPPRRGPPGPRSRRRFAPPPPEGPPPEAQGEAPEGP